MLRVTLVLYGGNCKLCHLPITKHPNSARSNVANYLELKAVQDFPSSILNWFRAFFPLNGNDPRNHTKSREKTLTLGGFSWIALGPKTIQSDKDHSTLNSRADRRRRSGLLLRHGERPMCSVGSEPGAGTGFCGIADYEPSMSTLPL